jgi:hypothetical protein
VGHKGRAAIQAIAQQQGPLGQLRQQLEGQCPLGLAAAANRGGEGIVQPHFQQDVRRQLREGGAPAAGLRLGDRTVRDLRRIGQAELRPIERDESPSAPERIGVAACRPRAQGPPQQVCKSLPRQASAPIRPRTVGERFAEQLEEVVGQGAGALHDVKGKRGQQVGQGHARLASAPARQGRQAGSTNQLIPRGEKSRGSRRSTMRLGRCRHSQRKYRFLAKSTSGFSHQRISERH